MKRALSFVTLLCVAFFSISQESQYCGTQMPEEMLTWLRNHQQNRSGISFKQSGDTLFVPLTIHIVGNDDGAGYYKTRDLLDALCHLNDQYSAVGFYFYIKGEIDFINNEALYVHPNYAGSLASSHNVSATLNIYFVSDPAGNCGYFSWGSGGGFIAVKKTCAGPDNSTVAHEIGHYFSLPHTFFGWEGRNITDAPRSTDERVNGSNCSSAADGFCDTPADYISNRWNCPYNGTKTDYVGNPYEVDGSFFMSYANDACQDKFSPEQTNAMTDYLTNNRKNHLNHPVPEIPQVGAIAAVYPPDSSIVPFNYVNLKWKKVAGAEYYNLLVTRYLSGSFYNVDMITQDTSVIVATLDSGFTYYWKVRPYHRANTCTGYTINSSFITSDSTPIVPNFIIQPVSCPGQTNGSINIGASGGAGPYTFRWSNGDSVSMLTGLSSGNYLATITDVNQDSLIVSLDVAEPDALDLEFIAENNTLTADVSGGTPPYYYLWSDGSDADSINLSSAGSYAVIITDEKGCQTTKTFVFTTVPTFEPNELNVYPNPVSGEYLTIEIPVIKSFRGNIELYDNAGKVLAVIEKQFPAGRQEERMDISRLSPGLYLLKIQSEEISINRKFLVF